jgi:hypothetical protein
MRKQCSQIDDTRGLIDRCGLDRGDFMLAKGLLHNIEAAGQRGIAEQPLRTLLSIGAVLPMGDFSGFVSATWALAAASKGIDSLDRCIAALEIECF